MMNHVRLDLLLLIWILLGLTHIIPNLNLLIKTSSGLSLGIKWTNLKSKVSFFSLWVLSTKKLYVSWNWRWEQKGWCFFKTNFFVIRSWMHFPLIIWISLSKCCQDRLAGFFLITLRFCQTHFVREKLYFFFY